MPRPKTSSARFRALLALPLLALALAGCGTAGSGSTNTTATATGPNLAVYLSDPPAVRANPALQDVADAERLAWSQQSGAVTHEGLKLRLEVARGQVSDNARTAIGNDSLIAYLGEIQSGQSRQTVGILNDQDVLALSPTDTVRPTQNDFEDYSTYGRTFASVPLDLTTSPAALNKAYPAFKKDFSQQYGHAPTANAIYGYAAVWVLLRVLSYSGAHANQRGTIATRVIATLKGNQGQASVPAFAIKTK